MVEQAAKQAVKLPGVENIHLLWTNYKALMRQQVTRQVEGCTGEQTKAIKVDTPVWLTSRKVIREWKVKLTRLRIGHCRFTHEYLLKGYNESHYQECIVPLTVMHILVECPSLSNERRQTFNDYLFYLLKDLWDRPKGGPSSRSTGKLAHCCHETEEYRSMWSGPCTPHYRIAQNEKVVAN